MISDRFSAVVHGGRTHRRSARLTADRTAPGRAGRDGGRSTISRSGRRTSRKSRRRRQTQGATPAREEPPRGSKRAKVAVQGPSNTQKTELKGETRRQGHGGRSDDASARPHRNPNAQVQGRTEAFDASVAAVGPPSPPSPPARPTSRPSPRPQESAKQVLSRRRRTRSPRPENRCPCVRTRKQTAVCEGAARCGSIGSH
jgi:hypothetical protein